MAPEDDHEISRECERVSWGIRTALIDSVAHATVEKSGTGLMDALSSLDGLLRDLSSKDRNILMGMLNNARNTRANVYVYRELRRIAEHEDMSQEIKFATAMLVDLMQKIGINAEDEKSIHRQRKFADEVLLYIRATDPYGVNILNPHEEPWKVNAIDLTKKVKIIFGSGIATIEFCPLENGAYRAKIKERPTPDKKYSGTVREVEIPDNTPLHLGRPLAIARMFDQSFAEPVVVSIDIVCAHPQISRGACMMIRKGDRLYFYDRGSKSAIQVCYDDMGTAYSPSGQTRVDGVHVFGDSQILSSAELQRILSGAVSDALNDGVTDIKE